MYSLKALYRLSYWLCPANSTVPQLNGIHFHQPRGIYFRIGHLVEMNRSQRREIFICVFRWFLAILSADLLDEFNGGTSLISC